MTEDSNRQYPRLAENYPSFSDQPVHHAVRFDAGPDGARLVCGHGDRQRRLGCRIYGLLLSAPVPRLISGRRVGGPVSSENAHHRRRRGHRGSPPLDGARNPSYFLGAGAARRPAYQVGRTVSGRPACRRPPSTLSSPSWSPGSAHALQRASTPPCSPWSISRLRRRPVRSSPSAPCAPRS